MTPLIEQLKVSKASGLKKIPVAVIS